MSVLIRKIGHKLNRKILTGVLLVSGLTTLVISSAQIYWDYSKDVSSIKERLSLVKSSYVAPIENSMWEYNEKQVSISLKGIINLPDIEYVKIVDAGKVLFFEGQRKSTATISKTITLRHNTDKLGELTVVASTEQAMERAKQQIVIITFSQLLKTLITSFFILILVKLLITRHIVSISKFFLEKKLDTKAKTISLDRTFEFHHDEEDELDQLVNSVNLIMHEVDTEFTKRKRAETELLNLNKSLETKVENKTKQLVESKKIAALGEMAGGIAHEINTPLTVLHGRVRRISKKIDKDAYSKKEIVESLGHLQVVIERIFTITNGLRYFAFDSHEEKVREVNINSIISNAVKFSKERYRNMNVPLSVKCSSEDLIISCKENSLIQIIVTLIKTSLTSISMEKASWSEIETKLSGNEFEIVFRDSAVRMNKETIDFIEIPFSERSGVLKGSGLELGMVKGIVELHNGTLWLNKEEGYDKVIIKIPV